MRLLLRPIVTWPGELTKDRRPSPFRSTYSETLQILDRELDALAITSDPVIQLAIREEDLRLDGELRANARPETHPGVILSFTSRRHGELSYPCDTFDRTPYARPAQIGWQQNLRAVALGLEALRKVERYGIANRGQQYTGWKQLGAGTPMPAASTMTVEEAARFIADHADLEPLGPDDTPWWQLIVEEPDALASGYRRAAKILHPDAGGDAELFKRLQEAKQLLEATS
jgi:hypothetical protein